MGARSSHQRKVESDSIRHGRQACSASRDDHVHPRRIELLGQVPIANMNVEVLKVQSASSSDDANRAKAIGRAQSFIEVDGSISAIRNSRVSIRLRYRIRTNAGEEEGHREGMR